MSPVLRSRSFSRSVVSLVATSALVLVAACADDDAGSGNEGTTKAPLEGAKVVAEQYAKNVHAELRRVARQGARAQDRGRRVRRERPRGDAGGREGSVARGARALPADRGLPLLRRPDRRRGRPAPRGSSTRGRSTRTTSTTSRTTPTAGIINDPTSSPTITRDAIRGAERGGRREEHRDRLPRDRVPALGPGPRRRRETAGARPYTDYVDGGGTAANQDRRGAVPEARRRAARRAISSGSSTRGRRARTTTAQSSSRRSEGSASRRMLTGMGSAGGRRARRRAHDRRAREPRPGGRALLLQRQHARATSSATRIGIQNVYLGRYGRERRARASTSSCARSTRRSTTS